MNEMDLLTNSMSLLDEFLSRKSGSCLGNDLASKDNSQATLQSLQKVAEHKNQLELAEYVASDPKWAETIVSFAVLVFEGRVVSFLFVVVVKTEKWSGHAS